jgi:hypothetical protein
MTLIDNLNAINDCKNAIKDALARKGYADMDTAPFSEYAGKIDALQLESGDTPSTPTPEAVDYIYTNGYLTGGTETNDIVNYIPYEITFDSEDKFVIELTCPEEIPGYKSDDSGYGYRDVVFTVDVPVKYQKPTLEYLDEGFSGEWLLQDLKVNPRYSTINRKGVEYNSYVRKVSDDNDYGSVDIQYAPLKYRITILKN